MNKKISNGVENNILKPPIKIGEIVKGEIVGMGSSGVIVDLCPFGSGIIYKKDFSETNYPDQVDSSNKDNLKKIKIGDEIFVKIMEPENEDGYFGLSLTEAKKELAWKELEKIKEKDKIIKVKISRANKGGLMAEIAGIFGFLPLSQLSSAHYPRVKGGDTTKILEELQKLIGKTLEVKIFDLDPKQKNLIFSEKAKEVKNFKETLKDCKINDEVQGEITGITDFGIFIKFSLPSETLAKEEHSETEKPKESDSLNQLEGLIHISEINLRYQNSAVGVSKESDLSKIFKINQEIKAKIIKITEDRIYLSLKNLEEKSEEEKP